MRRLIGVVVVALLAGCGGGGGGKSKHPDAGGDGSNAGDHPMEAPANLADVPADVPADGASGGSSGLGADASDAGSAGADGAAGGDAADAGADAADALADVVSDAAAEAEASAPRLVTVAFTGQVITVAPAPDAGMPLGFDGTVRLEAVSGSFTYDLRLGDDEPTDPKRGKYQRGGTTAFTCTVKGHTVTGSGKAIVETEDLNPDTFRFLDGPQGDMVVRTMQFDGVDAPLLTLGIAITDGDGVMLTSDALPDPFPTLDIANANNLKISHTFSLKDGGGTLLMKLATLVSQ